jgi:type I restriction enzyme M protein
MPRKPAQPDAPALFVKKKQAQPASVEGTIKSIQQIMWQDVGVSGDAQRIEQLVWMIFLKIFDDKEREYELDRKYKSPLPEELRWRNWAGDENKGLTGEELLKFVNNELFEKLKTIDFTAGDARGLIVGEVFRDAYNYMKSGTLLRQVINKINEINFNNTKDRHDFNDIYETILRDLQSAGNAGEYYTPRPVTRFIVERVKPCPGERVLDVACGTGGFLAGALDFMKPKIKSIEARRALQDDIIGYEKKPLPHLLCITNMMLHGVEVPRGIHRDNLLTKPLIGFGNRDRVDVITTNPPFGGVEEDSVTSSFPTAFKTKETADLFLLLMSHLLKPGGRGAVVLPDGSLFGEGGVKTRIKEKFLQECNLHTVVRLPNGVFSPYTSIKTNLLFFTKGEPTGEIWFYEQPLPEGRKNYTKTAPIKDEDFAECIEWWDNRAENKQAWKYDFRSVYEKAMAEATPFWEAAREAEERAKIHERDARETIEDGRRLEASLRATDTSCEEQKRIRKQLLELDVQRTEHLRLEKEAREAAREAKTRGDAIYDPVYNLDIKNPNNTNAFEHMTPQALADDILEKEQRIAEIMTEIKAALFQTKDELQEAGA